MNQLTIEKTIPIECAHLGPQIFEKIREKLQTIVGECTSEFGYITAVGDFEIIETLISRATTEPIIKVKITVSTLKPTVGSIYRCKVTACIGGNGLYAQYNDKLRIRVAEKMLIPKFQFVNDSYKSNKKTILVGDMVDIKVIAVKYNEGNFLCIGSLVT